MIRSNDIASSKAGNLQKMRDLGFPVPALLVLNQEDTALLLEPLYSDIQHFASSIEAADSQTSEVLCDDLRSKIKGLPLNAEVMAQIKDRCNQSFGLDYRIAVRSSALLEDTSKSSFAGQMETFLHVGEEALEEKIKACLASSYRSSAVQYRRINGFSAADGRMEVVLQQMVVAEHSGVLFTMNPNGNLNDTAVVVGRGEGEGVVGGTADTDQFLIDRTDKAIRWEGQKRNTSIGRKALLEIDRYGLRAEEAFGKPQDLEFSFDRKGKLWILQSRPITNIPFDELRILDNSNIIESYPGLTLPLSFSFARASYEGVFTACFRPFGIAQKEVYKLSDALANLLEYRNGRIYYRLDNWYRMMSKVMSSEKAVNDWERNLGIPRSEIRKTKISYSRKIRSLFVLIRLLATYRSENRQFFRLFKGYYARLQQCGEQEMDKAERFTMYRLTSYEMFASWASTQVNDFITFRAFSALQHKLSRLGFEDEENLCNDLMCGMTGVESELPMLELLDMKVRIQSDEALRSLFKKDSRVVLHALQQPQYQDFYQAFEHYLKAYGDRKLEELKLETPSLRRAPEQLVDRLKQQLDTAYSRESIEKTQNQIRSSAAELLNARLPKYRPQRWIVDLLIAVARFGLRSRENMRLARARGYGAVKDIFVRLAEEMVHDQYLNAVDDVFYLDQEDLEAYCYDELDIDLKKKVLERKEAHARYKEIEMPNRVIYAADRFPYFKAKSLAMEDGEVVNKGIPVSRGIVEAEVIVLEQPAADVEVKGKILVTRMTDPGWLFLMSQAKGLISEKGSLLSHTAIVGRELGLPTIVGIDHATKLFKTGQWVRMDGASGRVELLEGKP